MAGRLLIAHGDASKRILLAARAAAGVARISHAASLSELRQALSADAPDILLLDLGLPGLGPGGLARIAATEEAPPMLALLPGPERADRIGALRAGAADVIAPPYPADLLLALLRKLVRDRDADREVRLRTDASHALGFAEPAAGFAAPARVRVIAPGGTAAAQLRDRLDRRGPHRVELRSPAAALGEPPPDAMVLTDPGTARTLLPDIRSWQATRHVAVLAAFAPDRVADAATALDLGANDAMTVGPDAAEMALRLDRLITRKRAADRLRRAQSQGMQAAVTDPLTGLFNRRYAFSHAARMAENARASGRPWALIVGDLDHFKQVNDRHGHVAGDAVLQAVAQRLRDCLRAEDFVARIGGEEFLIAMPDTDRSGAVAAAERIRRAIADDPVPMPGQTAAVPVTMSLGVALARPGEGEDAGQDNVMRVIARADRALYGSKERGRNSVTLGHRPRPAA